MDAFQRTRMLIGDAGLDRLAAAHVAVFGLGGVGGAAAEALARGGVGTLTLVDGDAFSKSNLNRQLGALRSTLGVEKAVATRRRIADIIPDCRVTIQTCFFREETRALFDFSHFDYVIDAIDQVSAKLLLVESCRAAGVPLLSCMGTGNRLDPTKFQVGDINQTQDCGLARVMRRELRRRGIEGLRVVYSTEPPQKPLVTERTDSLEEGMGKHSIIEDGTVERERESAEQTKCPEKGKTGAGRSPGSVSFVPPVAGFILAGEAVRHLLAR